MPMPTLPFESIVICSVPDVTSPKISVLLNMPVLESLVKENVGSEMEPKPPLNDVPEIMFDEVMSPDVIAPVTFRDDNVPTPVMFGYAPTTDAAGIVPDEMFEALRLVRPEPVPEIMPFTESEVMSESAVMLDPRLTEVEPIVIEEFDSLAFVTLPSPIVVVMAVAPEPETSPESVIVSLPVKYVFAS